ncbi:MAG: hypothetical protein ACR2J8_08680, partial [Thermomicrobiales bacterium]
MSAACPSPPAAALPNDGFTPFPVTPAPPSFPDHAAEPDPSANRAMVRMLAGFLALGVALAAAGLLYWRLVPSVPVPPPLPPVSKAQQRTGPASIESAMPDLQKQADAWLPGATPRTISMQIDWPTDADSATEVEIPAGGWINASFVAPWDAPFGRSANAATLAILYDRGSGQIVQQDVIAWETAPAQPPAWTGPPVDSLAATRIAESAAGRAFRTACPEFRRLSRILLNDDRGTTRTWQISYEDQRAQGRQGLVVDVDATTGAVLDT